MTHWTENPYWLDRPDIFLDSDKKGRTYDEKQGELNGHVWKKQKIQHVKEKINKKRTIDEAMTLLDI